MLVDVRLHDHKDVVIDTIDDMNGVIPSHPRTGIYIGGFNFQYRFLNAKEVYPNFNSVEFNQIMCRMILNGRPESELDDRGKEDLKKYQSAPDLERFYKRENWKQFEKDDYDAVYDMNSYGVCDDYEQLLSLYDFEKDPRNLCISLAKITKSEQSSSGGWRWHKWGPYVGRQTPTTEYIFDEPEIKSVFVFHIYEILG